MYIQTGKIHLGTIRIRLPWFISLYSNPTDVSTHQTGIHPDSALAMNWCSWSRCWGSSNLWEEWMKCHDNAKEEENERNDRTGRYHLWFVGKEVELFLHFSLRYLQLPYLITQDEAFFPQVCYIGWGGLQVLNSKDRAMHYTVTTAWALLISLTSIVISNNLNVTKI